MMKKLAAALAVTGAALTASGATAQSDYPERPITMVIPLGAGGSHDLNARVITSIIPSYLEQAVIVRLSPGAGGQLGTQEVANAPADGYTLLFTHNYIDMLQQHVENLPYNPSEDFVTVARVNYAPIAIAVRADSPYETMDDLIEASRENPGSIQMAHSGNWGALFVPAAQFMQALDMSWNLVPYQGGGPALQALLAGDADVTMGFPSSLGSHLDAGTIRILATAGPERIYDDVPTFSEVGVEGDVGFMHRVVLAPADTPEEALTTLREAFEALGEDTTFNRMMGRLGENIDIITGDEYEAMRAEQSVAYEALVNELTSQ
ncbi:Bug family tripartite tricarboxylate transporter substrate binding protein [Gymnodinialimonas ceratoperidinii]|uniref:Tripartite tricarboxylate transporter substrate binding protein n=1 Tax=Gymnodinialimonas ceratoperidinii TaxID=2856823 RepID=A0A8F6TSJ8_9RHOB|nr:tripartite tricarboxylate transporter substrate binding protein [Gymnodinialimonas ceratoperidinii]QXT38202.1 tripartite tricarboxylate transporter substrate binding protein [Gymnodinialimonas ceratoperidinii]